MTTERTRVELDDASLDDIEAIKQRFVEDGFPATNAAAVRFSLRTTAKQLQGADAR